VRATMGCLHGAAPFKPGSFMITTLRIRCQLPCE
jgi:hypothetical protein